MSKRANGYRPSQRATGSNASRATSIALVSVEVQRRWPSAPSVVVQLEAKTSLAAGNVHAGEMDDSHYAAWSDGANLANFILFCGNSTYYFYCGLTSHILFYHLT